MDFSKKSWSMLLSRNQFFLLLALILIVPLFIPKLFWLAGTNRTIGEMRFTGHGNLGSVLGLSTYPVIRFQINKDTVYFNGNLDLGFKPGDKVPVRYSRADPPDAKIDSFICIWMDMVAYAVLPLFVLLVLYLMPDKFDPIIPRKSKILIGRSPILKIIK
jgi:hypothetical protein